MTAPDIWRALRTQNARPLYVDVDTHQKSIFSYNMAYATFAQNGWIPAEQALPHEYDLVYIRSFSRPVEIPGWLEARKYWRSARGVRPLIGTFWKRPPIDSERYEAD